MLRVVIRQVHPEHVGLLRAWLREVDGPRRTEALATLAEEGCTHEQAVLIEGADGPILVYVMEIHDEDSSRDAAATSGHKIDAEHKRVMALAVGQQVHSELLLDLRS